MGRSSRSAGREELPTGIRRRGSRFTAHGYDPDKPGGSKHLGTFATVELAVDARERHQRAVERKRKGFRDFTCDEFCAIWCVTDYLRPEATSNEYYRDRTRAFARDFAGVPMRDVTWDMARLWAEGGVAREDLGWLVQRWAGVEKVAGGWRVPSHRSNVKAAKTMFRDALRSRLIESDPFASVRIRQGRGRRDIDPPTVEMVQQAVDQARILYPRVPDVAAMIGFAAYSGLRLSELCGLRWEDLDFENTMRGLHVRRQYRSRAKGHEDAAPKHGSERHIVLTPQAAAAVRNLPRHVDGFVFHTKLGRRMTHRAWSYYWYPVRGKVAGMESMEFHMMRHFYGSLLGNQPGVTPRDIAHQLGHKDGGRMAAELYVHTDEKMANGRVAALFGG